MLLFFVSINLYNYSKIESVSDKLIDILIENNDELIVSDNDDFLSREIPFETRYVVVKLHSDGTIDADVSHNSVLNEEEAVLLANEAIHFQKNKGYIRKFRFRSVKDGENYSVYFVNCEQKMKFEKGFLISCVTFATISFLGALIVVILLSEVYVIPVMAAYEKQNRFISNAAHELKTPLTVISANNELIELEEDF